MQVDIPQIFWHDDSARIMSIDFYPNSNYFITASLSSDEDTGLRVSNLYDFMILVLGIRVIRIKLALKQLEWRQRCFNFQKMEARV